MTAKDYVRNAIEFKLNSSCGKCAHKNRYSFFVCLQARRLYYLFNYLLTFKHSRRDRVFHYLYQRQRRGLRLSAFLCAFEGNTVFTRTCDARNLSVNCGLEQKKRDKPKDECYCGPDKEVGHMCVANVKLTGQPEPQRGGGNPNAQHLGCPVERSVGHDAANLDHSFHASKQMKLSRNYSSRWQRTLQTPLTLNESSHSSFA